MKITLKKTLLLLLCTICFNLSNGQTHKTQKKIYKQKDFEKNKIFEKTYHLWQSKNPLSPLVKDSISYFVDDRNYKGVINYGIEYRSKDFRTFNFFEDKSMFFLKVAFESCKFNSVDNTIEIEGYVSGGWGDNIIKGKTEFENNIDIFIGEKTDTINSCYFKYNLDKGNIEITWNNKTVDENFILDSFSSFYFKKFSHVRIGSKGQRPFKIRASIKKNSILAFGGSNCYSEIFDIGAMVFTPKKNKLKIKKLKSEISVEHLIIKNKLVTDIDKEKNEKKTVNYYIYTKNAEDYILKRQYAKAKEQYNILNQSYPSLFSRDIHNAIRCSLLSRDYQNTFFWCEKLAQKGVPITYFNAKIFNSFKKNPNWNLFSIKYDSIYKIKQGKLNSSLKQKIEKLVDEDQNDYGLATRKDPKILHETTEKVTDKLIELLKNEGFPSEEKIGIYIENDTIMVSNPNYTVLITHAIQQKVKNLAILNELLKKSADIFEYDYERSNRDILLGNSCFTIYKGNLYNDKSCGTNELLIKKLIFKFNNPYDFIMDYGDFAITEYNKENPTAYDNYFAERFNFVIKLTDDWEFYEK